MMQPNNGFLNMYAQASYPQQSQETFRQSLLSQQNTGWTHATYVIEEPIPKAWLFSAFADDLTGWEKYRARVDGIAGRLDAVLRRRK